MAPENLATTREIAKLLRISQQAVRNLLKKGLLKGFHIDSRFRILTDSLPQVVRPKLDENEEQKK